MTSNECTVPSFSLKLNRYFLSMAVAKNRSEQGFLKGCVGFFCLKGRDVVYSWSSLRQNDKLQDIFGVFHAKICPSPSGLVHRNGPSGSDCVSRVVLAWDWRGR